MSQVEQFPGSWKSPLCGVLAWLFLLYVPGLALALPEDRQALIFIEADSVEIDDAKGVSIYKGNVQFTQGTTRLTADEARIYTEDRKIKRMVATGEPARYRTRPEDMDEDLVAEALTIKYFADTDTYEFHEEAHVWQAGNEFFGAFISYDATRDVVHARKDKSGRGRVHVILQPKESGEDEKKSDQKGSQQAK
ncbi:MAG TPA: lipopolysaccharide transport periplasmic protein LptA [Gammaproteobacteria bacterium]|nr:lipopolysaccharide transport periplasmic protein LptA [Gammaproteobacteria bacterium]